MTRQQILDKYSQQNLTFLQPSEFDKAIIGVSCSHSIYAVAYSRYKIIQILLSHGMDYEEADEYYEFNIHGAYFGESTPIYIEDQNV